MPKIAATEEQASCLIANLVAETRTPCPCAGKRGLRIEGNTYDGRPITICVDMAEGVLHIEGMTQEEVDAIAQRRCPLFQHQLTDRET